MQNSLSREGSLNILDIIKTHVIWIEMLFLFNCFCVIIKHFIRIYKIIDNTF